VPLWASASLSLLVSNRMKSASVLNSSSANEDKLAQACAQYMFEKDKASQAFGIELLDVKCGGATAIMEVKSFMLNGHKTCHGGHIFTLADSAFAFACNSQNQAAVASSCTIDFIQPALKGDRLTAIAEQAHQGSRTGIYHVKVMNQHNQTIAFFKGNSARIKRNVLPAN